MEITEGCNIMFFFSTTIVGGAETNILKISKELANSGFNIYWCYLKDDGYLLEKVDFPLRGRMLTGLYFKEPIKFYRTYKKFISDNKIEIVLNFGLKVEIISRLLSKRFGVKKIISNIRSTDDWRRWHHTFLDKITQGTVDLWVSNSIAGKNAFIKREGIAEDRIKVIYNFFEKHSTKINPKSLNNLSIVNVGILANITKEKGYFDLLPLAQKLKGTNKSYKFLYAGTDKINGEFQNLIRQYDLKDSFEYLGYISDKESFFNKIDVFLLPSYLEGMPTVVLEALSYGKPVVATNVGGVKEVIESGRNGYVCEPGDIDCIMKSLEMIVENDARKFVELGELSLSKFSKENIMDQWLNIIFDNK